MPDERTIGETPIGEIVETQGNKTNIVLDSQVLTAVMNCPCLADLRFNHRFISISGKANSLECGSIVHTFMEFYYKCIIEKMKREEAFGHAITAAELYIRGCQGCSDFIPTIEIPKAPCGHNPMQFPGVKNTPKDSVEYKTGWQHVLDTCAEYHEFYRSDHWIPLEVEVVKGQILYEDDEIRIMWKAKLDWVVDTNQGIFPVDHKTMKQRRDTLSLNNQFIGQCLLMGTRSVIINKIGFQKTLKPVEKFVRAPVNYTPARFLEWQSQTLPHYARMLMFYAETGYWPMQFGHCEGKYGKCAFTEVCEADPILREDELKRAFIVGPEWNPTNEED